jgi:hypothetical protein
VNLAKKLLSCDWTKYNNILGSLKSLFCSSYSKNPRLCVARVLVRVNAIKNHIKIGKRKGGYSRCCLHGSTSYNRANRTGYLTTFGTSSYCTSVLPCKQHLEKIQRTRKTVVLHVNPSCRKTPANPNAFGAILKPLPSTRSDTTNWSCGPASTCTHHHQIQ